MPDQSWSLQTASAAEAARKPATRIGALCAYGAATLVVLAFAIWLMLPRFGVHGVATIDDWYYVVFADPQSVGHLLHQLFVTFSADPYARFRPSSYFWGYVEWHLTGAPGHVFGAHLVQLVRQVFFLAVIGLVPAELVRRRRPETSPAALFFWALVPPAALLASVGMDVELFGRSGPQEPGMVSEILAGGVLLALGLKRRLAGASGGRTWAILIAGYLLLLIGALEKETGLAFLIVVPAAYVELDRSWRGSGLIDGYLWRERSFQVLATLCALPFLREFTGLVALLARGTASSPYGTTTTSGSGLVHQSKAYFSSFFTNNGELATKVVAAGITAVVLLVAARVWTRRALVLEFALILTAGVILIVQSTGSDAAPRYAMPTLALLAMACVLLAASLGTQLVVAAAVAVVAAGVSAYRWEPTLVGWSQALEYGVTAIKEIDAYDPPDCPVYMSDNPGALAIPHLVHSTHVPPACAPGAAGVLLSGQSAGRDSSADQRILDVCAPPGWQQVSSVPGYFISTCARFRKGNVGGASVASILRTDRLIPTNLFLLPAKH